MKDLFDLTREDLIGFDVVIDAFGAWTPETLPLHKTSLAHLCDALSGTKVRLLVVGGAGSLYVDPEHTVQVKDLDSFPEAFRPLATNMGDALPQLRKRSDVLWTYLSPAGDFVADGARTLDEAGADLYNLVLEVAGGKLTCAERKGFREISIFKDGVVL